MNSESVQLMILRPHITTQGLFVGYSGDYLDEMSCNSAIGSATIAPSFSMSAIYSTTTTSILNQLAPNTRGIFHREKHGFQCDFIWDKGEVQTQIKMETDLIYINIQSIVMFLFFTNIGETLYPCAVV